MENDNKIIVHRFNREITIYAVSDVHLGSLEHNKVEWEKFIELVQSDPDAYIVLVGDLMNNATRSSVSNVFEDVLTPAEQKDMLIEYLKPLKGKILCGVPGNHESRSGKDVDNHPMYDIMRALGIEHLYRRNVAYMEIKIGKTSYLFAVTHGSSTSLKKYEDWAYTVEGLDCLITGHTHKGNYSKPERIVFDLKNGEITSKPISILSCQAWMKYGGYAMRKMLRPSSAANAENAQRLKLRKTKKVINLLW